MIRLVGMTAALLFQRGFANASTLIELRLFLQMDER
jgi:hypothetical protein